MNIIQCTICKKPFQSLGKKICHNCLDDMDACFIKVRDYLEKHPNDSVEKVAEETEVSQRVIMYLIKEGRLIIKGEGNGLDGMLVCEVCKKPIFEGRICNSCKKNLVSIIDKKAGVKTASKGSDPSDNIKAAAKIIS